MLDAGGVLAHGERMTTCAICRTILISG